MSLRAWVAGALAAATALGAMGCETQDLCSRAPTCEENRSINCDYNCAGCSGTPDLRPCGAATCQVAGGDRDSVEFFRDRAVCVVEGTGACDPAASPAPTCTDGIIRGCSEYRRIVEADCGNASRYFKNTACCTQP